MAAFISCPIEVACVRMSNDATLPVDQRRNYKGMQDVFTRIYTEEGIAAFYRGVVPFSQRAALVGVFQVATMDQFTDLFQETLGYKKNTVPNVFCSAMSSGLIYSLATMPLEACKNRMASQKPDPTTGKLPYTSTLQALRTISANEGFLALYNGFAPYYIRCGGHTVCMFVAIQMLRSYL
jgi:solute carrier family 25 oxoglutarate transporter 11